MDNENKNVKIKSSRAFIFTKALAVTLSILTMFFTAGWLVLANVPEEIPFFGSLLTPPEIPVMVYTLETNDNDFSNDSLSNNSFSANGEKLNAPRVFADEDRKELFFTFLIVGLDDGGSNTDTIILASYDGVNKEANLISVQRDSKVNVSWSPKKINSVYAVGTQKGGGREGGIEQLKGEIKKIVGFSPDFHILVDMKAFKQIIDAVGGVDVYAGGNMVYDDSAQNLHINISAGNNHLDGKAALEFSRYRKGNYGNYEIGDTGRIKNQQQVISSVAERILMPENIRKMSEFLDIFTEYVYSDLSMTNMMWFAEQINKIKETDALTMNTLPTNGTSRDGYWYEFLDADAIVELVNDTINPYTIDIESSDLNIINY